MTSADTSSVRAILANRSLVALSVARMVDAVGNSMVILMIPLYVAEISHPGFALPEAFLAGLLIALFGFTASVCQPAVGALSDRLGRRKPLIILGLAVMGSASLGFIAAGRFAHLLVLRAIQGAGAALSIPTALAIMTGITRRESRGTAMGVFTTFRVVGFASGPLIGGVLYVTSGLDAAFVFAGAATLVAALLVYLWVPDVPPGTRVAPAAATADASGEPRPDEAAPDSPVADGDPIEQTGPVGGSGASRLWRRGDMLALAMATFAMAAAFSLMSALENEFNARLDQTALAFGVAFSTMLVGRLLLQLPLGRLSDRVGRKPLVLAGLALMAPATVALGWVGSTLQLIGVRFLQGVASAAIAAPGFALAADLSRAGGEGRQISVVTTGFGLGVTFGPLLAGALAGVSFQLPFVVGGALTLVGFWVVHRWVPETVERAGHR